MRASTWQGELGTMTSRRSPVARGGPRGDTKSGKSRVVDTAGRVEQFRRRYGTNEGRRG